MILQGVGHQISCLGVCYANDPKKQGYMTPAPALDLTTSLRGDFLGLFFFERHLYKANEFQNNLPSQNLTVSTVSVAEGQSYTLS